MTYDLSPIAVGISTEMVEVTLSSESTPKQLKLYVPGGNPVNNFENGDEIPAKYKWDLSDHKDDQYVTNFNKKESEKIANLFHQEKYSLNVRFKLDKNLENDTIIIFFSTSTLDESIGDDIRIKYDKWNIWGDDYR